MFQRNHSNSLKPEVISSSIPKQKSNVILGIDEAGRGPVLGPFNCKCFCNIFNASSCSPCVDHSRKSIEHISNDIYNHTTIFTHTTGNEALSTHQKCRTSLWNGVPLVLWLLQDTDPCAARRMNDKGMSF